MGTIAETTALSGDVPVKRGPAPMPPTGVEQAAARGSVASGTASSADGSSDDMPAELELLVVLPDGSTRTMVVDSSKQMMDLLVQVAAANKLSPASHALHVYTDASNQPVEYKASQIIGSLHVSRVQLINKKQEKARRQSASSTKQFEITQRLTVNLPRNQRFVTRVNPKDSLAEIYKMICETKHVDPYKHELRHPTHPDEALNMASPLEYYGLNEIYVVPLAVSSNGKPADLVSQPRADDDAAMLRRKSSSAKAPSEAAPTTGYMPGMDGDGGKKKKGLFSLFSRKKSNKFRPQEQCYNISSSQSMSQLDKRPPKTRPISSISTTDLADPPPQASKPAAPPQKASKPVAAPQPASKSAAPDKPQRKKRPAPPPPLPQTAPPPPMPTSTGLKVHTKGVHSRNSSHSSGFDESNMSPLESPGNSSQESMKTGKTKTSNDATSVESEVEMSMAVSVEASASAPPVTAAAAAAAAAAPAPQGETQGTTGTLGRKKRRAPAPPPPGAEAASPDDVTSEELPPLPQAAPPPYTETLEDMEPDLPPPPPELLEQPLEQTYPPPEQDEDVPDHGLHTISYEETTEQPRPGSLTSEVSLTEVNHAFDEALMADPAGPDNSRGAEFSVFNEQMTQLTLSADSVVTEDDIENKDFSTEKNAHAYASDSDSDSDASSTCHYDINVEEDREELDLVLPEIEANVVLLSKNETNEYRPIIKPKKKIIPFERRDSKELSDHSDDATSPEPSRSQKRVIQPASIDILNEAPLAALPSEYDGNLALSEEITLDHAVYVHPSGQQEEDSFYAEPSPARTGPMLDDYRMSKLVQEETVDYQFGGAKPALSHSVPRQLSAPSGEPVSNLRQIYRKPQRSVEQQYRAELSIVESKTDAGSSSIYRMMRRDTLDELEHSDSPVVEEISLDDNSNVQHVELGPKHLKDSINTYSSYMSREEADATPEHRRRSSSGRSTRTISEPCHEDISTALSLHRQRQDNMREETRRLTSLTGPQGFGMRSQRQDNFAHAPEGEKESILEEKSLRFQPRPVNSRSISSISPPPERAGLSYSHQNFTNGGHTEPASLRTASTTHLAQPNTQLTAAMQEESKRSLQRQYDELQRQFTRWQQQLLENQKLLARKNLVPSAEEDRLKAMSSTEEISIPVAPAPPPVAPAPPPVAPYTAPLSKPPRRDLSSENVSHKPPSGKRHEAQYERSQSSNDYSSGRLFSTNDLLSAKSKLRQCKSESDGLSPSNGQPDEEDVPREGSPASFDSRAARSAAFTEAVKKESRPLRQSSRFEPQLDPREELMIAIRNAAGRNGLRKVPVKQTKWHYGGPGSRS